MHRTCLKCDACKGVVGQGDPPQFYPKDGKIYCSAVCLARVLQQTSGIAPPNTDLAWGKRAQQAPAPTAVAQAPPAQAQAQQTRTPAYEAPAPPVQQAATPEPAVQPVSFSSSLVVIKPKADTCVRCAKKVYEYERIKVREFSSFPRWSMSLISRFSAAPTGSNPCVFLLLPIPTPRSSTTSISTSSA
jgi:hypothetical protein